MLSPDGKRLAWVVKTDDRTRVLKVMAFPGGTPGETQRLAMVGNALFDVGWSPDNRFVYFFDRAPEAQDWRLFRTPAGGGEAQDLGLGSRYFEQISIHPDGLRVTYGAPALRERARTALGDGELPAGEEVD